MGGTMSTKNVVFIPNINLKNGRSTPYHYSVDSWKQWCNKNKLKFSYIQGDSRDNKYFLNMGKHKVKK